MLKHINETNEFDNTVKQGLVLVDFFATWCGPCRMLAPLLEELAEEKRDLTIVKVDVDEAGALAARYGIRSIPTLFLFKDGQIIEKREGYQNKNQLLGLINR